MDKYGIGQALKGFAYNYFQSARRSGRTTALLERLKDDDMVVFCTAKEASRVRRSCAERGVEIRTVVVDPGDPSQIYSYHGPVVFDHTWVEQFYLAELERIGKFIERTERRNDQSEDRRYKPVPATTFLR